MNATAQCHGLRSEKEEVRSQFAREGSRPRSRQARNRSTKPREPTYSSWIQKPQFTRIQGKRRDTTPRQDSLSGVIICPAYWKGQRLKVNSLT